MVATMATSNVIGGANDEHENFWIVSGGASQGEEADAEGSGGSFVCFGQDRKPLGDRPVAPGIVPDSGACRPFGSLRR